ncbi:hypothetical protein SAMD00019534_123670 [Acytostelium subglobosum LB1]|uniref:hypothetical protein n=1 Tax=Acytostelium subglobosum LB1 TaxID=1410327 RepID=UPI000644D0BC|nr:hypothetical protein SAMD00019534_123670 [Acytostelium subglobosum LB1]GAM29191.1 hypothetical protein SAMD00019534_123670 [Acytostelium subglobosum LB1]|eukprot:XP_012747882.1 hypothetical protein SAMD00019534_123670 [Acytostelium subglobosum LB1]
MTSLLDSIVTSIRKLKSGTQTVVQTREIESIKPTIKFICDGCKCLIEDGQERFCCSECPDFDLCKTCWIKEVRFYQQLEKQQKISDGEPLSPELMNAPTVNQPLTYSHTDSAPLPHLFTREIYSQQTKLSLMQADTTYESMQNSFREHKHRRCLGQRRRVPVSDKHPFGLAEFVWLTFEEVYELTETFGKALASVVPTRTFMGICANNCLEWYTADFAGLWYGMPVVPIHHQVSTSDLVEILDNADIGVIVISSVAMDTLVQAIDINRAANGGRYTGQLRLIIHMENEFDVQLVDRVPSKIDFKLYTEMMELGKTIKNAKHNPFKTDEIISVVYTSGSTGTPKGVITKDIEYNKSVTDGFSKYPSLILSFATLSHSQRENDHRILFHGGRVGLYSRSMESLFDDVRTLRPSSFWAVPRVWNLIYSQYVCELDKYAKENPQATEKECKSKTIEKFSGMLGNRLRYIGTGGAPISSEVLKFMQDCWHQVLNVCDSYGLSEVAGIFIDGRIADDIQFRLEPVPEFGYSPSDQPNPRGELVVKSARMSTGYHKNEELTKQSFVDGWFFTGDIVEQIGYRRIKIIDRKKHAFKLSNGEFVAPEPLENVFRSSNMIEQIFIHGDRMKTFLVAIVIPRKGVMEQFGLKYNIDSDAVQINRDLKSLIFQEIQRIADQSKLMTHSIPKTITVDNTIWTIDNHLLTGSGKFCRRKLYAHYKDAITKMYESIEIVQSALRDDTKVNNAALMEYVKSVLGVDDQVDISKLSFTQIGGDSLGAVRLSSLLKEKVNINVSPQFILNKNNNLQSLARMMEMNMDEYELPPVKIDWEQEMVLEDAIQMGDKTIKPIKNSGNCVFLTGATGFLGSFLLFELITKPSVESVLCLVRSVTSEQEAFNKLVQTLTVKYRLDITEEQKKKIVPVLGDLELPRFGLSEEEFISMANRIDFTIHNGAIVNMLIPYPNMRAANVGAVQEVLRLACSGEHIINTSIISTIGTFTDRHYTITENAEPTMERIDHMNGYNQSKLVAEQLVYEAKRRGLPLILYRPGTIFAHTGTGIDNDNDFVSMTIRGIISMGACPVMFKEGEGLFNLSPVDWVSSSIVGLSLQADLYNEAGKSKPNVFHMVNETSVSLDDVCSAIQPPLERCSFVQWRDKLDAQMDNPLYPLRMAYRNGFGGYGKFKNPTTSSNLDLINMPKCPYITDEMLAKNIQHLMSNLNK